MVYSIKRCSDVEEIHTFMSNLTKRNTLEPLKDHHICTLYVFMEYIFNVLSKQR